MRFLVVVLGLLVSSRSWALDVECRFTTGAAVDIERDKTQVYDMAKEQISSFSVYGIDSSSPTIRREKAFTDQWGERELRLISGGASARYFTEVLPAGNVQLFTWYPTTGLAVYSIVIPVPKVSARIVVGTCSQLPNGKAATPKKDNAR